jgi:hypothetical protein
VTELRTFKDATISLLGFLTVLAITNSIRVYLEGDRSNHDISDATALAALFLILTTSIRFFYGNIVHLKSDRDEDCFEIVIDCITILLQGILVGFAAFFVLKIEHLLIFIFSLYALDIVWFALRRLVNYLRQKKDDADARIGIGIIVSSLYVICFVALTPAWIASEVAAKSYLMWIILILFNGVDLLIHGPRYVGRSWHVQLVRKAP